MCGLLMLRLLQGRLLRAHSETATAVQDLRVCLDVVLCCSVRLLVFEQSSAKTYMLCLLQVLQDGSAVPVVAGISDFQAKLIARHLEKTEQLFAQLQACVCIPRSPSAVDTPIASRLQSVTCRAQLNLAFVLPAGLSLSGL